MEIYGSASDVSPSYTASSDHSATVMINSTDAYSQNVGASISLGGRSYPWGGSAQPHIVYARMSGVQQPSTNAYEGNFVVETLYQNTGGLREALRIDGNGNVGIGTMSPETKLDVAGTLKHQGLTLNEGTSPNVDEIKTFTKNLSISTSWIDTGIIGSDLETGSYIIQVFSHNGPLGQYHSTFTGFMSWYNTVTNSNYYNEVLLHSVGNDITNVLYIRTQLLLGNTNTLKLQIRLSGGSGSGNFTFKFRRMI
jgi:hypothetical protein